MMKYEDRLSDFTDNILAELDKKELEIIKKNESRDRKKYALEFINWLESRNIILVQKEIIMALSPKGTIMTINHYIKDKEDETKK